MISRSTRLKSFAKFVIPSLLLLCTNSQAHPDATSPDFCPNGLIKSTSTHTIKGDQMVELSQNKVINCPVGIKKGGNLELDDYVGKAMVYNNPINHLPPTHDVFDGAAKLAYTFASCLCASITNTEINLDVLRPQLIAPSSLINDNHHDIYDLQEGLSFTCNICLNLESITPPPSEY